MTKRQRKKQRLAEHLRHVEDALKLPHDQSRKVERDIRKVEMKKGRSKKRP